MSYAFQDSIRVDEDIGVPEAEHFVALALKPRCPFGVSANTPFLAMVSPVDFDYDALLEAGEVSNVWAYRLLPSEFDA